jgi:hypothetical protein
MYPQPSKGEEGSLSNLCERAINPMKKSKGRRKVGRKKRRMRAKIRHRK